MDNTLQPPGEGWFDTQAETARPSLRLTAFKWTAAAAVILLCTYISINYFNQTEKEIDRNLLTRQNMETTTLATTLEDGSIVYLAGNAAIHYPEHFQPDKREVSLQGNALFRCHRKPYAAFPDRNGRDTYRSTGHGL